MQHKEESRKPGGGALHQGRAGASFFYVAVQQQAAGGRGVPPPIKGEAGLIGSAARYEYVHSPGEHKNKFSPMPQISMQNERKREIVLQTRNKSTYPPPYEGTIP